MSIVAIQIARALRFIIFTLVWLLLYTACCRAQYTIVPLCKAAATLDHHTPQAVIKITIPANTVRILYSLSTDTIAMPDSAGLAGQAAAHLPDKLGWLGIAHIADSIKGTVAKGHALNMYVLQGKGCVNKFALHKRRKCRPFFTIEQYSGGTKDMPWQGVLFSQTFYIALTQQTPARNHLHIEIAAIVAD